MLGSHPLGLLGHSVVTMIKEDSIEEIKIDLGGEEQQNEDNSALPQNETIPLVENRDPKGVNAHLRVTFEDVIAEPQSIHSFDRVWLWSHALFEVSRLWFYRIISLILAVPVSLIAGILLAILSCLHIWCVMPCVRVFLINMPSIQTIWGSILDTAISPFFRSMGKCCSTINVHLSRD
ncbi:Caveolin-2 [Acipenser ruthenus]|uniref:Caveolin n=2 Tax=Acipenser ruthenus TaxID=7906 RepID=A0A444V0H0_ACIRT|nr:Caveolin-2 [Acipenser ruthenus]